MLVVGAGGLGCPALFALAGKVELMIVDDDRVDLSNLQRQILHRTQDLGRLKAESARDAVLRRWPASRVLAVAARVDENNVGELLAGCDVVVDGTDSFTAKFLLNDACLARGIPLVHGGVVALTGQLMTVLRGRACFRCIFEAPPPAGASVSCQDAGVLGAVAGVIGGLMAKEVLAILDGRPELAGVLLRLDAGSGGSWRRLAPRLRDGCAAHVPPEVATW